MTGTADRNQREPIGTDGGTDLGQVVPAAGLSFRTTRRNQPHDRISDLTKRIERARRRGDPNVTWLERSAWRAQIALDLERQLSLTRARQAMEKMDELQRSRL
jgi:hypothetical protein